MARPKSDLKLWAGYIQEEAWQEMQREADSRLVSAATIMREILQSWMNKRRSQGIRDKNEDYEMTLEEYMNDPNT